MTSVLIPNSVTEIGPNAFLQCFDLEMVIIPNSVTKIGERAFEDCYSLEDVTLSRSLKRIEKWTFKGCDSLKSFEFPASVTYIDPEAFLNTPLEHVTAPAGSYAAQWAKDHGMKVIEESSR